MHAMLDRGLYDRDDKRDPYFPQEARGMRYSAGLVSLLWTKVQHLESRLEDEENERKLWVKVMTDKFADLDKTNSLRADEVRPLQV